MTGEPAHRIPPADAASEGEPATTPAPRDGAGPEGAPAPGPAARPRRFPRGPLVLFRRAYGAGPLNLIASLASFALAGYAFAQIIDGSRAIDTLVWFVGAILLHDFVFFPVYSLLDRIATGVRHRAGAAARAGAPPSGAINYVRVPAALSGIAFVLFLPLILQLDTRVYGRVSGLDPSVYLGRWLLLTAALFLLSGLAYAVRLRRRAGRGSVR